MTGPLNQYPVSDLPKNNYFPSSDQCKRQCLSAFMRVWKGIFGIRDLTKIQCEIRENAKYLDGIRELTVSREAGLSRIWARDAGILA